MANVTFIDLMNIYSLYHGVSFYPSLLSFHLQTAYRKVRNLQIGVNKLVGKVLINLLHHTKLVACIIMDAPTVVAVAYVAYAYN